MTYEYIPYIGCLVLAGTTVWAGLEGAEWKYVAKVRLALLEERQKQLSEARIRIQENETDLANFAEYKRKAKLWDEAQAKAKPRKSTAKSKK